MAQDQRRQAKKQLPCFSIFKTLTRKLSIACPFNPMFVYTSDIQPPTFVVKCPQRLLLRYAERERFTALVNWTEPVATDNSGVLATVTSNYQSPQRFSQGTHVITYTAVDQSGNKATCSFAVKVIGNRGLALI